MLYRTSPSVRYWRIANRALKRTLHRVGEHKFRSVITILIIFTSCAVYYETVMNPTIHKGKYSTLDWKMQPSVNVARALTFTKVPDNTFRFQKLISLPTKRKFFQQVQTKGTNIKEGRQDKRNTVIRDILNKVVFIIRSQVNKYHLKKAILLKKYIMGGLAKLGVVDPQVILTHNTWPKKPLAWTIVDLWEDIIKLYGNLHFAFFAHENTNVSLTSLAQILGKYDHEKHYYLGRLSSGRHLEQSGTVLTMALLRRLATATKKIKDMLVDPKYGNYYQDNLWGMKSYIDGLADVPLTNVSGFCAIWAPGCASWFTHFSSSGCGNPVPDEDLYYAVKTNQNYFRRIGIIQKTWGKDTNSIELFSDLKHPQLPTVVVNVTEVKGQCKKMQLMLERFAKEPSLRHKKWLLLLDDDVILSVPRLRRLLSCYDYQDKIYLGERYAYHLYQEHFQYITGGAGTILSRPAVEAVVRNLDGKLRCITDIEDLELGEWMVKLNIGTVHNPLFHQWCPYDLPLELIEGVEAVTFHPFGDAKETHDPLEVYLNWLLKCGPKPCPSENATLSVMRGL